MALTLRTNGSSGVNLVTAQWWNDYYNLVTGVMTDQVVTFKTDVIIQTMLSATISAPTLALGAGTSLGVGAYSYFVTFVDANGGETYVSQATAASITTTTGNTNIALTVIPTGPTGTVSRRVYRTKVGGSTYFLVTTISDNVTTTYTDSIADTSLVTSPPANPSFGGTLLIKNSAGAVRAQIFTNGAISFDNGSITSDGAGDLTAVTGTFTGNLKIGPAVSGSLSSILYQTANNRLVIETPTSGADNFIGLFTWNGTAQQLTFAAGTAGSGALSYIDDSGNMYGQQVNARGSGTGNDDLVLLTRTANTTQTIKLGVDNTGAFYIYDANASNYIFQGLKGGSPLTTNRNGTNTAVPVYTGTTTPTTPPTGAIWIKA